MQIISKKKKKKKKKKKTFDTKQKIYYEF